MSPTRMLMLGFVLASAAGASLGQVPAVLPTSMPTSLPATLPTGIPTGLPTTIPTGIPTGLPTTIPTGAPTGLPTAIPTGLPTAIPTGIPAGLPTALPTGLPTGLPTAIPTAIPTTLPAGLPGLQQLLATLLKGNPLGGFLPGNPEPGDQGPILWGPLMPAAPGGPLELAKTFLARYGPLFGVPADPAVLADPGRLGEIVQRGKDLITILPKLDGVPFPAGQLNLQFGPDGGLTGVFGQLRRLESPIRGVLDAGQSAQRAIEEMSRKYPQLPLTGGGDVQEYFARNASGAIEHMYQVDLVLGTYPRQIRLLLDSKGTPIGEYNVTLSAIPDAKVFIDYPRAVLSVQDLRFLKPGYDIFDAYPMPGWKLRSNVLDDDHHKYNLNLDGHFKADPYLSPGNPHPEFLAQNCYHHLAIGMVWAWHWGMPHWPATPLKFEVLADQTNQDGNWIAVQNNAAFLPGRDPWVVGDHWGRIVYARQNPLLTATMALDASFTYHEVGHGIHWLLTPTFNTAANGAIQMIEAIAVSEGASDAFAALVANHPTLGAIAHSRSNQFYERNCAVPPATTLTYALVRPCYMPFAKFPGAADNGEVHVAGQVISSAFWEIYLRKRDRNYTGRLLLRAMQKAVVPHTMLNFAHGVIAADRDPDVGNGANIGLIQGIFRAKGFPGF